MRKKYSQRRCCKLVAGDLLLGYMEKHAHNHNIEKFLKSRALRITPARVSILSFLNEEPKPITVEDLEKGIKKFRLDQSTIYRTVNTLIKEGIIRELRLSKEKVFIEIADADHHHIVCTSCGFIEETDGCITEGIENKTLKKSKNFKTIESHSLEFFGVCKDCAKK